MKLSAGALHRQHHLLPHHLVALLLLGLSVGLRGGARAEHLAAASHQHQHHPHPHHQQAHPEAGAPMAVIGYTHLEEEERRLYKVAAPAGLGGQEPQGELLVYTRHLEWRAPHLEAHQHSEAHAHLVRTEEQHLYQQHQAQLHYQYYRSEQQLRQQPLEMATEQQQQQQQQPHCQPQQQQQSVLLMHHYQLDIVQQSTCSAEPQQQQQHVFRREQMAGEQQPASTHNSNVDYSPLGHHHHHLHQHHSHSSSHHFHHHYPNPHTSAATTTTAAATTTSTTAASHLAQEQNFSMGAAAALRHYWREIGALCLLSAVCLNCVYLALKRRFFACIVAASPTGRPLPATSHLAPDDQTAAYSASSQTRSLSKDTNSSLAQDSAFEDPAPSLSLTTEGDHSNSSNSCSNRPALRQPAADKLRIVPTSNATVTTRQRSSTLKADSVPQSLACDIASACRLPPQLLSVPPAAATNTTTTSTTTAICSSSHHNSVSTSLSSSLTNTTGASEYVSRYSSDFHSIQRLGRGGFGIVFEARNKIDDCHYAVKRICLPLEAEARERVMREVRALAKLDHAGIVRYYNAWLETPPEEWLKQHDAKLGITHSKDGFPSTDGIYDGQTTRDYALLNSRNQSGDSSLFNGNAHQWNSSNRRPKGLRKYLKNNSSSPSLDIVFEGSGSIRLESDKLTESRDQQQHHNRNHHHNNNLNRRHHQHHNNHDNTGHDDDEEDHDELAKLLEEEGSNLSDNNISDSEDSDFIQFESRGNNACSGIKMSTRDLSVSQLTDPFSSSSSSGSGSKDDENRSSALATGGDFDDEEDEDDEDAISPLKQNLSKPMDMIRKNAIAYQNKLRKLNNASLGESLHVEKVYLYIQMQLCRKDTLKDWMKTNCEHRDKTTIFDLFYQIVDAVEYVHSQDLIHRDLKPSNIFFSLDGTLKIGDFGLCRTKTSNGIGSSLDLQEYVAESDVERSFEAVHTEQVGTQLYMSPEQLNGLSYNQKVDIFAMGLILLELLIPFKTQMQRVNVLFKARNNLYSEEFQTDHPLEHELVKSLLSRSPLKRPTANEIKQHELLANAQLSQPVIERIYHRRRTISSNSSTE